MMGLPLITCLGGSFSGRVAGSLLCALGMAELVTHTVEEYESLALKLALDPVLLAKVKRKLICNREVEPIFNMSRLCRHIEIAYTTMWKIQQNGEAPRNFDVDALPSL